MRRGGMGKGGRRKIRDNTPLVMGGLSFDPIRRVTLPVGLFSLLVNRALDED